MNLNNREDLAKLKDFTGWNSWWTLFIFLHDKRHFTGDTVEIIKPGQKGEPWTIQINDIKAAALDEILPKIPSINEVIAVKNEIYGQPVYRADKFDSLINKLPVK